jgi:hypothetical protein
MAIREYYYFVGHLVCGGLLHCGGKRETWSRLSLKVSALAQNFGNASLRCARSRHYLTLYSLQQSKALLGLRRVVYQIWHPLHPLPAGFA